MSAQKHYDAIIIGAGVSGLYQLHRLRKAGFSVRLFEKADGVGGTWYWNRYPGCRFDSESYTYAYSFSDELLEEWNWSEHFAGQPETLAYLNHVADKFNLRDDIQFNTRIRSAAYNEGNSKWAIESDNGEQASCQFLIMATGILSAVQFPDLEGIADFKGQYFHTARWPHEPNGLGGDKSVYTGKRVAVIGAGASAVQVIPHVAKDAQELVVFQRTANWASPLFNSPITDAEQPALKAAYPEIFKACDSTAGGFVHQFDPRSIYDVSEEERNALFEKLYKEKGFSIWLSNFPEIMTDMRANKLLSDFMADKIRQRVDDPAIADKLVPSAHGFGQRRVPMETNYYEAYNQDNVQLVDLNETPIERITATGVITTREEFEFDLIIYATGFDAGTGAISRIDVRGTHGESIKDKWAKKLRTYMGLQVEGYPNMFIHIGPHAAFCNIPRCAQVSVDWVSDLIEHMRTEKLASVEATEAAEIGWTEHAVEEANKTLLSKTNSWIMGDNVAGKPRALLLYAGPLPRFRQRMKDCAANDYEGFSFTR
ncbi:MAG: flavin-containing monooxygenase [Candidatus Reddybacter sp.]